MTVTAPPAAGAPSPPGARAVPAAPLASPAAEATAGPPPARPRHRRTLLAAAVSVLIIGAVFGLALPHMASYGHQWQAIAGMTLPGILLVAASGAVSLLTSWVMIRAFLPRLRLREAAAVNLSSSAVANTVPAGGAVALGLTWRMLASWGVGTGEFVRYTLVSGLWNVFARLGLPVIALALLAASGSTAAIPPVAAYCGAGVLLALAAGFRLLLRSHRLALAAVRALDGAHAVCCRLARRTPSPPRMRDVVLTFRAGTSALLAERGVRITVTTAAFNLSSWVVLLACLRASGLTQAQVPWQASLAAFAVVRLLTVFPVTPGGIGIVELGLAGPLAAGLGGAAAARVAAAVLLYRAVTYLPSLPLGAAAYLWWRHARPRRAAPVTTPADPAALTTPGFTTPGFTTPGSPRGADHPGLTTPAACGNG